MSTGQDLTAELRTWFRIGPRTHWYRRTITGTLTSDYVTGRMWDAVALYPGIETPERTAVLAPARAALCAWFKHVDGYRIDPMLRRQITEQSPWAWTAYLGAMVDSGCTCNGEFESWFASQLVAVA